MFGFGKKYENEVEVIRQALRDQIIRAKQEEESGQVTKGRYYSVEKLIGSSFSSGYLYAFCRIGFAAQGVEVNVDKYLRTILNEVWREINLYRRFKSGIELAESTGAISYIFKEEFELGMKAGMSDGGRILDRSNGDANKNLYAYLINCEGLLKEDDSYLNFDEVTS